MAVIFYSGLLTSPQFKLSHSSFEGLILSVSQLVQQKQQPCVLSWFNMLLALTLNSESEIRIYIIIISLVLIMDNVILVSDFDIHVDINSESLRATFTSVLDCECVHKPTH